MLSPIDPTSSAFLLAEKRTMPMHVGGLQLFEPPAGLGADAAADWGREMFQQMTEVDQVRPLFLKHPHRSARTAGQLVWKRDEAFDIEHHVRHSALPRPGRIRELLELLSRLHGTRLAPERPLWECHVIEGLDDGRVAVYTKMHHALVDGVSAMRLMQSTLSTDAAERDMPPMWGVPTERPGQAEDRSLASSGPSLADLPLSVVRGALGLSIDAAGLPGALAKTLTKGLRNETSAVSLHAPRTLLNADITGSRRFAAQDWPIARLQGIGRSTGTTLNDVVLAMCAGAMRAYLLELDALPEAPLVAMVPVSLEARRPSLGGPGDGGNAVGAVMVQMATHLADPAERLASIHRSMLDGKQALSSMTPLQVVAMSALGQAPAILGPLLRVQGLVRPPYNLIISNVPGPRTTQYWNGARLDCTYPLSIPINGMALNITCTSYDDKLAFGLTGCRRTVPRLQRLLGFLDEEVRALERAAGIDAVA